MPLSPGESFAGYKIVQLLGSGGMGEVYLAEHPRLPRRDALKVLPAELAADADYRERFVREADLAANLWHPHIVSVHDRGEHDGQLWISMNYVDGLDAARLLAARSSGGLPVAQVVRIIEDVAAALDYAHKQGLLHRDVKPANIMLSHAVDGAEQRILLTDFGIARSVGEISGLTATNMTIGTVAYAAPEQLLGEDLDGRADQYALAATAFHLLTGSQLFPHTNPAVVIGKHLNATPPTLAASRPELSGLDTVLALALAKSPGDRFARCTDFARALDEESSAHGLPGMLNATRPALSRPASRPQLSEAHQPPLVMDRPSVDRSRRRWLVAGASVAALISVGVIALDWHPWRSGEPARSAVGAVGSTTATASSSGESTASTTTTSTAPKIIDVDPVDYESTDAAGYYYFAYTRAPVLRDCTIFPEGVACSIAFPPGTPQISNYGFTGPPNEVSITPPDGPKDVLGESQTGGLTIKTLLPNHRITVGDFTCTALTGGGIDCEAPTGGFRFEDSVLTKHGKS